MKSLFQENYTLWQRVSNIKKYSSGNAYEINNMVKQSRLNIEDENTKKIVQADLSTDIR